MAALATRTSAMARSSPTDEKAAPRRRRGAAGLVVRFVFAGAVLAGGAWAEQQYWDAHLPPDDTAAMGVMVAGRPIAAGEPSPAGIAARRAREHLSRRVRLLDPAGSEVLLDRTLGELGATIDEEHVRRAVAAIGHRGSVWQRQEETLRAHRGEVGVAFRWHLPAIDIVDAVAAYREAHERPPVGARWNFDTETVVPHRDGIRIDPYAAVEAIYDAASEGAGPIQVRLPVTHPRPLATTDVVAALDQSAEVAAYETVFADAGNQAGRAKNIARAAAALDGLVMMPGATYSFNDLVGPRSVANGFDRAGEIYKGEMRMGIGGGTCQVASTLHAAAYFGGLEVVQRAPHSRPSGYIGIGLDATVSYPTVDLKLRNPFSFPVVVRAEGARGRMKVVLRGAQRPVEVDHAASTVSVKMYKRKVRRTPWLETGKIFRKQKGRKGLTIEKVRTLQFADGGTRVERTRDVYPPTNEVYYLPPGADEDEVLPPLPSG
ncbi:MAG: VanW family protein [Myxococcota bacterium]